MKKLFRKIQFKIKVDRLKQELENKCEDTDSLILEGWVKLW